MHSSHMSEAMPSTMPPLVTTKRAGAGAGSHGRKGNKAGLGGARCFAMPSRRQPSPVSSTQSAAPLKPKLRSGFGSLNNKPAKGSERSATMSVISRRVDKLERETVGGAKMFVLCGPADYGTDNALADLQIKAGDRDLVVYIKRLVDRLERPSLVSFGRIHGPMRSGSEYRA